VSARVDVTRILERAGADAHAPEGSQAWALAQVGTAVIALTQCARRLEQRGFFAANSCADQATNADMARMRHALGQFQ
jgi:hypothetical protein